MDRLRFAPPERDPDVVGVELTADREVAFGEALADERISLGPFSAVAFASGSQHER